MTSGVEKNVQALSMTAPQVARTFKAAPLNVVVHPKYV
jgi:hypothetical protein